jgi:serine/threonine protein kinase
MSPEIEEKREHSGEAADIFAAGVVLFIMVVQAPPFEKAAVSDQWYNMLKSNQHERFWKIFDKTGRYSEEFKHLIITMFQYEPTQRLSMEQLKAHPWMKGDMPSQADVVSKMRLRKGL